MKARKKFRCLEGLMVGGLTLFLSQVAQGQSFSEGKNLFQLEKSLRSLTTSSPVSSFRSSAYMIGQTTPSRLTNTLSPVFLPRWSAEELPFFCRVEYKFAKKNAVPFKFRLGSVEYVDWLEGKGAHSSSRQ